MKKIKRKFGYADEAGRLHTTWKGAHNANIDMEVKSLYDRLDVLIKDLRYDFKVHMVENYPPGTKIISKAIIIEDVVEHLFTIRLESTKNIIERVDNIQKNVEKLRRIRNMPTFLKRSWYKTIFIKEEK